MEKFHADRMLKLADTLESVPRKEFEIGDWYEKTPCGIVACALGWACTVPAFKRAGLRMEIQDACDGVYGVPSFKLKLRRDKKAVQENGLGYPDDDGVFRTFNAGAVFFGIPYSDADRLFSAEGYEQRFRVTPKQVAKVLRKYVKDHYKPSID